MRRTMEDKKQELTEGLTLARRELLSTVRALPGDCADVVFLGVWSVKDLVAHLIGWDDTNIDAVQSVLAGRVPEFFGHFDRDWQSYNRTLVEKYRQDSLNNLLVDAEDSHRRLIAYLTSLSAKEVVQGKVVPPSGRTVTIYNLLRAEAGDEKKHVEQVKAYFHRTASVLANL